MSPIPQSYYDYATRRESGGDVFARNPRSTALGPHQFLDSTWQTVMQKHPELGLTADGRTNQDQSDRAMRAFTNDNAGVLTSKGFEPNTSNLYLAHRFGAQGALQLLTADPGAPMASVVSPAVMKANPDLDGKTVGQLTAARAAQASASGSQMPPQTSQVFAPALSPNNIMGPGALGGDDNSAQIIGNGMERAAAWLGSISDPKALGALASLKPDHDQFSVIQGQDGKLYRVSKKTGAVVAVDRASGDTIIPQTPGQKKVDEDYAKDFNDWKANGGYATAARNVDQLGEVIKALKTEQGLTGPLIGMQPDAMAAVLTPRALEEKQKAHGILQQNLRPIFGPQFTAQEGNDFLARTYDPRLPQDVNAAKLESVQTQMKRSAAAKQSAADYFEKHGSLTGWQGKLPSFKEDLNGDGVPDAAQTAPAATTAIRRFNPKTGKIE